METVLDESEIDPRTSTNVLNGTLNNVAPEPGPSRSGEAEQGKAPADNQSRRHRRLRYKGLYIEEFPDALAGTPISDEIAPEPDMNKFLEQCGRLTDPNTFRTAEMLLKSQMTNKTKDRPLNSHIVSSGMSVRIRFVFD